jgi:ribonucleotide monophosphatase NagD (HAD superfamily)
VGLYAAHAYYRPYLLLSPSAKAEFTHLPEHRLEQCDSVILGQHPPSLSYESLNTAFRILKREPLSQKAAESPTRQPVLIAPHTAAFLQSAATPDLPAGLSLSIGPFVHALEMASGAKATIVGKPTAKYFEMAVQRMRALYPDVEADVSDVAVVGDDPVNDLGHGSIDLGLRRILGECGQTLGADYTVRSGKYRPGSEDTATPPDEIFDTFSDFVNALAAARHF